MKYATGWIVSTAPLIRLAAREDYVSQFRGHGMSEAFIGSARKAAENDCWLLRFEVDADIDADLEMGGCVD